MFVKEGSVGLSPISSWTNVPLCVTRDVPSSTPKRHVCKAVPLGDRRNVLLGLMTGLAVSASVPEAMAKVPGVSRTIDDDFTDTPSGLRYLDIKVGSGKRPGPGSRCEIHWSGYTEGYQGKRFGNSSLSDEPFEFTIGRHEAIPAIEEAVQGMMMGGIRRVQIPGDHPELSYPRDRSERFDGNKYRLGPYVTNAATRAPPSRSLYPRFLAFSPGNRSIWVGSGRWTLCSTIRR